MVDTHETTEETDDDVSQEQEDSSEYAQHNCFECGVPVYVAEYTYDGDYGNAIICFECFHQHD